MKVLYTAQATASGGRDGRAFVRRRGGSAPVHSQGDGGAGKPGHSNPEQLFAAGYAACFEGAVRYVARQRNVALGETSVTARVGIGPRDGGGFGLQVDLSVALPGIERGLAQSLADEAHEKICPYSHATRGNVAVTVSVA